MPQNKSWSKNRPITTGNKAAAAALRVRTRQLDGPSRARCDGDRGCFAQRPQRHCELTPGGWTDRNGDGHDQGRHGTFSAAPRERLPHAQLGLYGPVASDSRRASSIRSGRASWARGSRRLAGWDWLGLAGWVQLAWLDRSGRVLLSREHFGAQLPAGCRPLELLAAPKINNV